MDVRVRELRLPGIGHRYELSLDNDRRLIIVVQGNGRREISILSGVRDEPDVAASLTQDQAVAVAAILTGARYSIDTSEDERTSTSEVGVETVTLNERSPAVGRLARDVPLLRDSEAAILAVIRDQTPELVEDDTTQPCQPGDRIVVAARRDRLDDVIRQLRMSVRGAAIDELAEPTMAGTGPLATTTVSARLSQRRRKARRR